MNRGQFGEKQNFIFGVATSAYQIEGGTKEDGRLESIWDRFCEVPGKIADGSNGENACEHYRKAEEDLELLKDLGVDAYRFSVSWCRLVTEEGKPNQRGIAFYGGILQKLRKLGIKSFVTLYHWDLPQWLENRGGWLNRETADRFADYAEIASGELGAWVDAWCTLNEPFCSAFLGYGTGIHAPGRKNMREAFEAGHHLLLAHGLALDRIRTNTPDTPAGIVLNVTPGIPVSQSEEDVRAANSWNELNVDWFFKPIFEGRYSPKLFGDWQCARPDIREGDLEIIGRKNDFVGINYYTVARVASDANSPFRTLLPNNVETSDMGWEINPEGLRRVLCNLTSTYPKLPPIFITENGMAHADQPADGQVEDAKRTAYVKSHLQALLSVIREGVDIRGYFVWSLMDNFEWAEGYAKRFGIYYVDYPTQKRIPKKSALWYREFLKNSS